LAKLVLDTSTLVSGFLFHGNERALLRQIAEQKHELFTSKEILQEFSEVIARPKFKLHSVEQNQIVKSFLGIAKIVEPKDTVKIVRDDPDDDKILECALACNADYIVSGDHHLLDLKQFNSIPIVRTHEILGKIQ